MNRSSETREGSGEDEQDFRDERRKTFKNLVEMVKLLLLLTIIVGLYLWWSGHRNKMAAEALKAEEERIRLEEERDRVEREKREKDRLEREVERLRQQEERKKERLAREAERKRQQEEREAERKRQQEERERVEREKLENRERYATYMRAVKENNFDIFTKAVTNEMARTGGELCYLLPSEDFPIPLYQVIYDATNGTRRVLRMERSGEVSDMDGELFDQIAAGSDHLVAMGDTVYFKSRRKSPATGDLDIAKPGDPAEAFFGTLFPVLREINPTYDELTFDILFTPQGSRKPILVENVPFGCEWSLRSVREAAEEAISRNRGSGRSSSRQRKFKRTVKIWDGNVIKRDLGGVIYVPRTPYSCDSVRWGALYARALKEDAEEAEFYASQGSVEERKWQKKVDETISKGALSYRIRKSQKAENDR